MNGTLTIPGGRGGGTLSISVGGDVVRACRARAMCVCVGGQVRSQTLMGSVLASGLDGASATGANVTDSTAYVRREGVCRDRDLNMCDAGAARVLAAASSYARSRSRCVCA
jgi:hypothetical protein